MGCVGKTALCNQFVYAKFPDVYHPNMTETLRKVCVVDDETETIDIVCVAGSDVDQGTVCDNELSTADGFVLVFAIDNRASFDLIPQIMDLILCAKNVSRVPAILVGNKAENHDSRKVTEAEALALASKLRCRYIETSARIRHNVDEGFYCLLRDINASAPRSKAQSKRSSKSSLPKESADLRGSTGSALSLPEGKIGTPPPQSRSSDEPNSCIIS